jgi:hypothetical protein
MKPPQDQKGALLHALFATMVVVFFFADWTTSVLKRLDGDPFWPPWITDQPLKTAPANQ